MPDRDFGFFKNSQDSQNGFISVSAMKDMIGRFEGITVLYYLFIKYKSLQIKNASVYI